MLRCRIDREEGLAVPYESMGRLFGGTGGSPVAASRGSAFQEYIGATDCDGTSRGGVLIARRLGRQAIGVSERLRARAACRLPAGRVAAPYMPRPLRSWQDGVAPAWTSSSTIGPRLDCPVGGRSAATSYSLRSPICRSCPSPHFATLDIRLTGRPSADTPSKRGTRLCTCAMRAGQGSDGVAFP